MRGYVPPDELVSFPPSTVISERVLFPISPTESRGMEDARFVRFVDDDGAVEVRVVNASDEPTVAAVGSPNRPVRQASTVSGRGVPGDPVGVTDGIVSLPLGPWQIATLRVEVGAPFEA